MHNMAVDDLYWNSIDFGSEESIPQTQKHYVDPWDLENYAYIRQHLDSLDLSSDPSSLEEPTDSNSSSFYYAPQTGRHFPSLSGHRYDSLASDQVNSNYEAIEEVSPYRKTVPMTYFGQEKENLNNHRWSNLRREESDIEENPYEESNRDSSLLYIYETRGRCRRIVMPSSKITRERSSSFSYGDCGHYDSYKQNVYSRLDETRPSKHQSPLPLYGQQSQKPKNFSLTNYGHLKIDYSYNWNSLDKYICK